MNKDEFFLMKENFHATSCLMRSSDDKFKNSIKGNRNEWATQIQLLIVPIPIKKIVWRYSWDGREGGEHMKTTSIKCQSYYKRVGGWQGPQIHTSTRWVWITINEHRLRCINRKKNIKQNKSIKWTSNYYQHHHKLLLFFNVKN